MSLPQSPNCLHAHESPWPLVNLQAIFDPSPCLYTWGQTLIGTLLVLSQRFWQRVLAPSACIPMTEDTAAQSGCWRERNQPNQAVVVHWVRVLCTQCQRPRASWGLWGCVLMESQTCPHCQHQEVKLQLHTDPPIYQLAQWLLLSEPYEHWERRCSQKHTPKRVTSSATPRAYPVSFLISSQLNPRYQYCL